MMRPWRSASAFLRVALVLVAALLAAEVLVRWLAPQPHLVIEAGLYEADPPGGYRLRPGYRGSITNRVEFDHAVVVDERGLRESPGTPGPTRLLVIGDSFTFGLGVRDDETFAARLARRPDLEVLNGGLPGIGVPALVDWYERHGRALEPALLLLAVFVGNDLADARPDREETRIVDGLVVPTVLRPGVGSWLYRHSDLARLAKRAAGGPALTSLRLAAGWREPWEISNLRWEFSIYATPPSAEIRAAEETTDRALARLAALCAADGTRLLAALVPTRVQLEPEVWGATLVRLGLDPASHDREQPVRVFARLLAAHGIPYTDLAPAFAAGLADDPPLYYRQDRHWTSAGHELAARELAAFLEAQAGAADGGRLTALGTGAAR